MSYEPTADEDIVDKIKVEKINLANYINWYLDLESQWEGRPQLKTVADQETLDFWNENQSRLREVTEVQIRVDAQRLYDILLPIYNAGLIPAQYNDELLRLKNFVEG